MRTVQAHTTCLDHLRSCTLMVAPREACLMGALAQACVDAGRILRVHRLDAWTPTTVLTAGGVPGGRLQPSYHPHPTGITVYEAGLHLLPDLWRDLTASLLRHHDEHPNAPVVFSTHSLDEARTLLATMPPALAIHAHIQPWTSRPPYPQAEV